jgi:hypothetical protein
MKGRIMKKIREYRVRWEIDILATSPREAAIEAQKIQRDPKSIATVFDVSKLEKDSTEMSLILTSKQIDLLPKGK